MRPPGDATDMSRSSQCQRAAKQLTKKPKPEVYDSRHLKEEWKKENGKHHDHSRCWKKYEVSAEHAGNRAGSAHRRHSRIRVCEQMGETSNHAAGQIENRESYRSHTVLDVVAKDPKCPHVGDDVQPAAVQKLMSQQWPIGVHRKTDTSRPIRMGEARRDNSEEIENLFDAVLRERQFEEKHQRVNEN